MARKTGYHREPSPLWERALILGVFVAVVLGFLALIGVFDLAHTVVLVATAIGLYCLISQGRGRAPKPWPAPPLRFRSGARTEVAQLAWTTVNRNGDVSEKVMQRVRGIARQSLAQHGVEWSGEAGSRMQPAALANQLLGAATINTLTTKASVRPRALDNAVRRLENLKDAR